MAHMALYRKWRPLAFEDVVEQRHIVNTLKNSIINRTISHAYLFCGTRGTGKTTLAKIFARAINCLEPVGGSPCNQCAACRGILEGSVMDVIEIDAASNNGVDDVREIKEAVQYVPAVAQYKVYIIDEVHMLSMGAFNALLKTLEEPPERVVFILATTEPHKLPATILSRCQRFDFKRISQNGLVQRLRVISKDCGTSFEDSAVNLIARLSGGGMRDAISLLDQCIGLGKPTVTREDVIEILGLTASDTVEAFAKAIIHKDAGLALSCIRKALEEGRDLLPLCGQLIDWFRNLMLIKIGGEAAGLAELGDEELLPVREAAEYITTESTLAIIKELSEVENRLKWSENQRILLEAAAVGLCSKAPEAVGGISGELISKLEARIEELENRLASLGSGVKPAAELIKNAGAAANSGIEPAKAHTEEKAKPSKGKAQRPGIKHALKAWPDVIEHIRSMGKMKVYAYLLDTQCLMPDDATAYIMVSSEDGLKKTVLGRNDSLEVIREALLKTVGVEAAIKIIDEKAIESVSPKQEEDPALEKIMRFASENNIRLDIKD